MKMVEVTIEGLALDMTTNSPVVILSPPGMNKVLPIWIGHAEAWGIAMELSGVSSKRPLTYDLLKRVIEALDARVDRNCGNRRFTLDSTLPTKTNNMRLMPVPPTRSR